eukprot:gnl/MRDRNA2_/MRDRNA2_116987_c0_seq1.p1 gnl/MRDRNA2_/MRDRNA2_116987_c0~~gnl/MRDRNA2_/MRDRNA2_116987_c0_seq1.p1  ORF type:complete len:949 (+),score=201.48 gnl/MRDRNA2_/MRDRNA2_116987_c0_seq1:68-2914(+)
MATASASSTAAPTWMQGTTDAVDPFSQICRTAVSSLDEQLRIANRRQEEALNTADAQVSRALRLEQKSMATKNEAMMQEAVMNGASSVPPASSLPATTSGDLEVLRLQLQRAAEAKARLESCVADLESQQRTGSGAPPSFPANSRTAAATPVVSSALVAPTPFPAPVPVPAVTRTIASEDQLWTCSRAKQEADAHLLEAERRFKSVDGAWRATEERSRLIEQEWTTERTLLEQEMREELNSIEHNRLESLRRIAALDAACKAEEEKQKALREQHARRWAAERETLLLEDDTVLKGLLQAENELKTTIPQLEAECKAQDALVAQLEEELHYITQVKSSAMQSQVLNIEDEDVINDFLGTLGGFDFGLGNSPKGPPLEEFTERPLTFVDKTEVAPKYVEVPDQQTHSVQAQQFPVHTVSSGPQLKLMPTPPEWSEMNAPLVKTEPSPEAPAPSEPLPEQHLCGNFRRGYSSSVGPLSGAEPRQSERLPLSRLQQASNIEQVSVAALPEDNYSIAPQVGARPVPPGPSLPTGMPRPGRPSSASRARELKGSSDIPVVVPSSPVREAPRFQGADEVAAAIAQARSATQRITWGGGAFGEIPTAKELPPPPLRQGVSSGISETPGEFVNPSPVPPLSEPSVASTMRGQRREPMTLTTDHRAPAPPTLGRGVESNTAPVMNDVHSKPPQPQQVAPAEPVQQVAQQPIQQVVEAPMAARETGKSEEPSGPKPPAKLDLVSLDGTRPGSVGLRWGGDDNSHLSVSRVELQIWSVDHDQILPMLGARGSPGTLPITRAHLQGCTVAFAHDLNVSFPDPKGPAPKVTDSIEADGPQIRAMLPLKQQQVAAHVGRSSAPAPVSIEGIPRQKPVVVRMRLYSSTLSPSDQLKGRRGKAEGQQKNPSRSRCGAWGKPCLLVVLPDELNGVDLQTAVADEAASAADDASLIKIKAWGNTSGN